MTRTERHANLLFNRIKQAVPDAEMVVSDYGLSFAIFAKHSRPRRAIWLRRVPRPDIGQTGYRLAKRHLPEAIQALR